MHISTLINHESPIFTFFILVSVKLDSITIDSVHDL